MRWRAYVRGDLAMESGHQELHRDDVDLFADLFTDFCHRLVAAGTDALILGQFEKDIEATHMRRNWTALAARLGGCLSLRA